MRHEDQEAAVVHDPPDVDAALQLLELGEVPEVVRHDHGLLHLRALGNGLHEYGRLLRIGAPIRWPLLRDEKKKERGPFVMTLWHFGMAEGQVGGSGIARLARTDDAIRPSRNRCVGPGAEGMFRGGEGGRSGHGSVRFPDHNPCGVSMGGGGGKKIKGLWGALWNSPFHCGHFESAQTGG